MTAEDLRKAILQQAIQGKLVPQDPNDEPASVLLERIREEKARLVKEKKIKKDKNESIIYRGEDNSHYEKILATGEIKCIDDEIPFEIPNTWQWTRMGNVGSWGAGSTPQRGNHEYYNNGTVLWLKTGELNNDVVYDTSEKITEKALKECSLRLNKIGDVLIAMYGATIGKIAIVGKEMTTNQACCGCSPYNGLYNRYLFFYLMANKTTFIKQGEGGAQPNISRDKLVNFLIPIPPLNEQKRIAQRIEEIQPLIDKYRIAQEQAEEMDKSLDGFLKKSVLQYAIQGKLVSQNCNEEPASALLEKIQREKLQLVKEGKLKKKDLDNSVIFKGDDNKYFEKKGNNIVCIDDEIPFDIPDSWEWVRFKNLVQFSLGKTPERVDSSYWSPNDFPWVSIADMEDKTTLTKTKEFISQKALTEKFNNTFSPIGTLIMSFKLTIGKVSILGINAVHNEAIISIFPFINEDNIIRDYLYNFLSIITGYTASTDAIKGATLNSKKISEMLVPLPPLQEQKRIVEALDNVLASIMRN